MYPDDPVPAGSVAPSYYRAIVGFPISCFVLAFFTDLAYWGTASYLWETISVWLLTVGVIGAGAAIVGGLVDLARGRRPRRRLSWPAVLGPLVAVALSVVNVLVHSRDGYTAVVPDGLILSSLVVLVLLATAVSRRRVATRRTPVGGMA